MCVLKKTQYKKIFESYMCAKKHVVPHTCDAKIGRKEKVPHTRGGYAEYTAFCYT